MNIGVYITCNMMAGGGYNQAINALHQISKICNHSNHKLKVFTNSIENFTNELSKNRNLNIDLIRGFAILLMIFDHALLAYSSIYGNNEYIYLFRITLTRFSMPLFMIISGTVLFLFGLKVRRWLSVFMIALMINIITINLWEDFNSPEILLVWCFVVIFYKIYLKFPITTLILGYVQTQFFQITIYNYNGYQPGDIIIFLVF